MARITNAYLAEPDPGLDMVLHLGPCDVFPFTDEELRIAWQLHRERVMQESKDFKVKVPGRRPWAWWQFEAGRDEHLEPYPSEGRFEGTEEERDAAIHEYNLEPLRWLADNGHLTADERAAVGEVF
jgi:hypothetical protein